MIIFFYNNELKLKIKGFRNVHFQNWVYITQTMQFHSYFSKKFFDLFKAKYFMLQIRDVDEVVTKNDSYKRLFIVSPSTMCRLVQTMLQFMVSCAKFINYNVVRTTDHTTIIVNGGTMTLYRFLQVNYWCVTDTMLLLKSKLW